MFESVSTVINDGEQYEDELETREDDALPIDRDGELTDEEIAVIALKRESVPFDTLHVNGVHVPSIPHSRERTYGAYKIIKTIVPGLNNLLTSAEPTELKEYFNTVWLSSRIVYHDADSDFFFVAPVGCQFCASPRRQFVGKGTCQLVEHVQEWYPESGVRRV